MTLTFCFLGNGNGRNKKQKEKKMMCWLTKHLKDNHDMWVSYLKVEAAQKESNKQEIPCRDVIQVNNHNQHQNTST